MKKISLFPFYNNNFMETSDEIADFLITISSSGGGFNAGNILKEIKKTTVIVPTNRVRQLLKFFINLSFEKSFGNNYKFYKFEKSAGFIPNIKTINQAITEFRDFSAQVLLKAGIFKDNERIINYEDKNLIIYDILRGLNVLQADNSAALFDLSKDITSLLNDFYAYGVNLTAPLSPDISDLIYGYKGIEEQFELILNVDKAYKDRLKKLNLIDGELLTAALSAHASAPGAPDTFADQKHIDNFIKTGPSDYLYHSELLKFESDSVFKNYYDNENVFIALINDVPPVHINFLNKLKENSKNFAVILPYIYPYAGKDVRPAYSIYSDFIEKMKPGMDKIDIKKMDLQKNDEPAKINIKIKKEIADSLFSLESENGEGKPAGVADSGSGNKNFKKWDSARIVSGLTVEDEARNVCALIKKDLLNGIKPQEIIVVLMEKSYAASLYSSFLEFGFETNFLVPFDAFSDKDVLYFYKALEMVSENFNYKNIINYLYLRGSNQDIISYITKAKNRINLSGANGNRNRNGIHGGNLFALISYIERSRMPDEDFKAGILERLVNIRENIYMDADTPLRFEEFLNYLDKLTRFLFQTEVENIFILKIMETLRRYGGLLNPKNPAENSHGAGKEIKYTFRVYFLLIARLIESCEITLKPHNSGITVMGKLEGRYSFAKSAYIMGLSEDYFPAKSPKDYLLTPKIKEKLGLPSYEKLELFQKSHFLSYMMLFDNVTFSYPVNIDGKKRLKSPYLYFIEDKLTDCDVQNETGAGLGTAAGLGAESDAENTAYLIKKSGADCPAEPDGPAEPDCPAGNTGEANIFTHRLKISHLSPKAISDYIKCGYKFYLDDILNVNKAEWDFDEKSPLIFGNIIHNAMKKFLDSEIKPLIEKGLAAGDARFLNETENPYTSGQVKPAIRRYLDRFRQILLNDSALNGLSYGYIEKTNKILELVFIKFLENLFDKVRKYGFNRLDTEAERVKDIFLEQKNGSDEGLRGGSEKGLKNGSDEGINIKLKGRIDLVLSRAGSDNGNSLAWIYDFKTGSIQDTGFAETAKNFADNTAAGCMKNANGYLSSVQLYTYAYMLEADYKVLGASFVLFGNSMDAQKTNYIKDIPYGESECDFNEITKLLIEKIASSRKNDLTRNLKNKNNCGYCDYVNICY